LQSV
jgi:hypothetical protein